MSAHFRELRQLLSEALGTEQFDRISIDEAKPIKRLLALRTIVHNPDESNTSIQEEHVNGVLQIICNDVLEHCFRAHKNDQTSSMRSVENNDDTSKLRYVNDVIDEDEVRLVWKFLSTFTRDEEMMALIDRSTTKAAVQLHYAITRPRQLDMFVHISATEMFFIDGDSLLMAALSSQHVDWDLMQPLHVLYNAQFLLRRMQSRGACFHVIFFEKTLWFWMKSPQKMFIRENLRETLTAVSESNPSTGLVVKTFESYHCKAFEEYVQHYEPEFFLISDGEQLGTPGPLHKMFNNGDLTLEETTTELKRPYRSIVDDEALGDDVSFYYHCFQTWAMARRITVAYSSRIISRENALVVFAVTSDSVNFSKALAIDLMAIKAAEELEREVLLPSLSSESKAVSEDEEVVLREQIIAGAVHAYLSRDGGISTRGEQEKQLAQAMVIMAYSMVLLSAEHRAQPSGMVAPEVQHFLDDIAPYMLQVLRYRGFRGGSGGSEHDIFDAHLLAVLIYHLRTTPVSELMDEDGLEDLNYSLQNIFGNKVTLFTNSPLAALPKVTLRNPQEAVQEPHLIHELVESLAKRFNVRGHVADHTYPSDFGMANQLKGWALNYPFDDLNDIIDAKGQEEIQRNMTEKDRKRNMKIDAAFVIDATQQAESMGIRSFIKDRLALVVSESDDDSDDEAIVNSDSNKRNGDNNNSSKRQKPTQQHYGQRNKKTRSKEDVIREETNLRDANRSVREWYYQVDSAIKSTDRATDRGTSKDRTEAISTLSAIISRLEQSNLTKGFDPGNVRHKSEDIPLKLSMWRLLVETSGMREAEFAFTIEASMDSKKSKIATRSKSTATENLYAFNIIEKLVQDCTGVHGSANAVKMSSALSVWGKIECLHHATQPPMSYYDAVSYLNWVYLSNVQLHFRLKLMCCIVKLQLDHWKVERERARLVHETPNIDVGIPLFLYCHHKVLSLIQANGLCISVDDIDTVRSALMHFDFPSSYYENVDKSISTWQGRSFGQLPPGMRPRQKMWLETPEMTQLMHMGHLLERPMIHDEDPRVAFNPDYWQRELLDIVDNRGSAVVCAPTSAGKTFISYYCMYKALKKSNRKVLVYLAPNRALINQAVADVCARYGSKKYSDDTKNVFGVHGGDDYHLYLDRCQVLVTFPEILETLLLSPKYTKWVENLNYVILDEIHTMESSGNGDVWERVLALLPCPFVALSATLGETHQLCGWLNRVQAKLLEQQPHKKRDFNVYTVPSSGSIQRWNDIKKYIYFPPVGQHQTLKKFKAKCEHHYIRDLHPLSILTLDQLRRGFPPEILLVPGEVVQLYSAMVEHFQKTILPTWSRVAVVRDIDAQMQSMKPEEYFKTELHITQKHARQYEVDVKNAFVYWVYLTTGRNAAGFDTLSTEEINRLNADMHKMCESILHTFSFHLREEEENLEKYAMSAVLAQQQSNDVVSTSKQIHFPNTKRFIQDNIIKVLRELSSRDMGPTIVFTFESESCDDIVNTIVEQLEQAEAAYRQTEEFAQYKSMMERKAAAKEAARKQRESNLKQKRLTTDVNGDVERNERNLDLDDGDDYGDCVIPDVLPEFSFIGHNCTMDPETIMHAIEECRKRGDTLAARAISRGVGIHHAGVKGKLRRLMEILFRRRHCGVICSTETLALGIHSPCRSVVLAGDHVLLNTTQFRQMMGRAGRRGLDFLGHLVFLGISLKKITRLMTSGMTVIKGNAQMDVISQLRLLKLHDFADHRGLKNSDQWKARVTGMAERLFVNPLFFEGRAAVEGGNMEGFTIELMQMLLWFFQKEGLHFKEHPSSLGSLLVDILHVFRSFKVGVEGIAFIMMLTRGVFVNADFHNEFSFLNSGVFTSTDKESGCTEALVELLAYLFSTNKMCGCSLEIHRSVLSDPVVVSLWNKKRRSGTARLHRVVLAPLRACCSTHSPLDTTDVFRIISAFYSTLAANLQKPVEDRLPYMSSKTKKKNPIFNPSEEELPLMKKLRATAVPFKARTPFVAISGCGDNFVNTEDLMTTLRSGLFCDPRYLPVLDFTDGCRHDGAQVLINACISDFARCRAQFDSFRTNYRFTLLEELNGLNQSECFAVLNQIKNLLSNIAGFSCGGVKPMKVLEELFPQKQNGYFAAAKGILHFAKHMNDLHWQIEKDYSVEQLSLKQMESRKNKV
ncbi:unnamed protein product [Phytomonas sp. Hart1]|nr:unnamed protein product [Phytomonas sp. Hart1]|eukprot:CCW68869.1 unnamed protein product [Phytomonas sp. isolate Hart1]